MRLGVGDFVEIVEVGPRDGLQNEKRAIPVAEKIALIDLLSGAGFRRIEAASFVSPKWVPQMAGSGEVMVGIRRVQGVKYAALTPNMRGLEDALAARVDEVAVFAAASESFSKANINATIEESIERFKPVIAASTVPVRGYVSCVVECPYEGAVSPEAVARVAAELFKSGCFEVSLGDTIGRGTPEQVDKMLAAVLEVGEPRALAGHYHDTGGQAIENITVSLERGLRIFDTAVGGLGGCPYAPGAAGNVATEVVAQSLVAKGFEHGLDLGVVGQAANMARMMRG